MFRVLALVPDWLLDPSWLRVLETSPKPTRFAADHCFETEEIASTAAVALLALASAAATGLAFEEFEVVAAFQIAMPPAVIARP